MRHHRFAALARRTWRVAAGASTHRRELPIRDPMRLLAVRQVQSRPDYMTEKALKSAIHWQGDIVPKRGGDSVLDE
jgi:hypothetical protein